MKYQCNNFRIQYFNNILNDRLIFIVNIIKCSKVVTLLLFNYTSFVDKQFTSFIYYIL